VNEGTDPTVTSRAIVFGHKTPNTNSQLLGESAKLPNTRTQAQMYWLMQCRQLLSQVNSIQNALAKNKNLFFKI
jgi:hypothetical protein